MATISYEKIIRTMLENDGVYPGYPKPWAIYEYRHAITNRVLWSVFYDPSHFDLDVSLFVGDYKLLWSKDQGHVAKIGILSA